MTTHRGWLFIGGAWSAATGSTDLPVSDSCTEQVFASYRSASPPTLQALRPGPRERPLRHRGVPRAGFLQLPPSQFETP